ncbi:hypothetical protein BG011_007950 [Mortierella polycephala]|uniref:S-adenosyl-L-methionine-dependent methyltransferase n=1 Tax=Mortierella polycephala TaxID=41804 RepID=A0A9P6PS79_9FUNG|nr:hypothetical protein BG011_007950 [Mortierella polycephala]
MSDVQAHNNEYFNKKAEEYDSMPQALEITKRACDIIIKEYTAATSEDHVKNASVLDFGCGTGLVALRLAPDVKHVLGVDASEGMLQHLNHKLSTREEYAAVRGKVHTVQHLVTEDEPLPESETSKYLSSSADNEGGFDLVVSNYVMHHIEDVQGVINTMARKLVKKDGWLIIIDLEGGHQHHHGDHGDHHNHQKNQEQQGQHHHHHHHHHQHHHQHGEKKEECHKAQDNHTAFVDENGKPLECVAHKNGFTLEGFAEIFKNAGLVDVSVTHAYGINMQRHGKEAWADAFMAKGRRA